MGGKLWTAKKVCVLARRLFGAAFTDRGMRKLLRRLGFSFQRPDRRAVEGDGPRDGTGPSGPGSNCAGRPRPRVRGSCSLTRSGSARTICRVAPGVARGTRRWRRRAGTGSASTP
ncbi:helix-turn-helix domain-containing protein [Glycomyces rhizosphaerae]|uniref:Winged helix-turn-helix domain-containing protein n=1 Tax=Glycomyces rhizosphaerae TaxID=2054422 RepID=A0ABV7PSX5_9ACTN